MASISCSTRQNGSCNANNREGDRGGVDEAGAKWSASAMCGKDHINRNGEYPSSVSEREQKKKQVSRMMMFGKPVLSYWLLMLTSVIAILGGGGAGALLARFYFVHGGADRWLYTFVQTAGWPVLVIPTIVAAARYPNHNCNDRINDSAGSAGRAPTSGAGDVSHKWRQLLMWSLLTGLLLGVDNLLFSWGSSYLPVSTSTLLFATQLAFNIASSYALRALRLSGWMVNAAVIVTTSAVLLGLQSSFDRPPHTTSKQYRVGFATILLAAAFYGLLLALTELAYTKIARTGKQSSSGSILVILCLQLGSTIVSTVFAMVGMCVAGSFSAMQVEYRTFDVGHAAYVATLVFSALTGQVFFLGIFGIISLSSSLLCCLLTTATIPLVSILGVVVFHDSFNAIKGVSNFLAIWGFLSYIYGSFLDLQSHKQHGSDVEGAIEI